MLIFPVQPGDEEDEKMIIQITFISSFPQKCKNGKNEK